MHRRRPIGPSLLSWAALVVLPAAGAHAAPGVSSVAPAKGNIAGGTPVTVRGSGFQRGATVKIGNVACTQIKVLPDSVILCVTGAHAEGAVSVTVFNTASDSSATNSLFTYNNHIDLVKTAKADFEVSGSSRTNLVTTGLDTTLRWVDWSPATGGSMSAATYYYVVAAVNAAGETEKSVQSAGTALSGGNNAVNLAWTPISGAFTYKLYRTTTSGAYNTPAYITTVDAPGYKDVAASASSGAPPGSSTATGDLYLRRGGTPATTFSAGPATTAAVGEDGFSLLRPDGKFLTVHGFSSNSTSIYDPVANTMSAGPNLTGSAGQGCSGYKRPDLKFLIVHGNASTSTSIYDPVANTMTGGPATSGTVDVGGSSLKRPDGKLLIIHGNAGTGTTIYDPVANTMTAGPAVTASVGYGGCSCQRPDGTFLIVHGKDQTSSTIYDGSANTMSAGPAMTASVGKGGHIIQRPDGRFLVVCGSSSTATTLYDPVANTTTAGPTTTATIGMGGHSIRRADGTFLVFRGIGTTGTNIYDPVANTMTAGPAAANAVNEGGHSLQRPDGQYLVVNGAKATNTNLYDAGWYRTGSYVSEKLNPSNIDTWNLISWVRDLDDTLSVKIKTATSSAGLDAASWRAVTNGAGINPGAGETWLQIGVDHARAMPKSAGAIEDVWGKWLADYRIFPRPLAMSVTASYAPVFSVAASKASFAYGTRLLNTWLPADSSTLSNDGTVTETLVAQISTFAAGASTWSLSASGNGPDQIRAQWSTTSVAGPWTDIAQYDQNFTVRTGLAASGTVKLYFRIQTPTSTSSYGQYASTLTVTAQ